MRSEQRENCNGKMKLIAISSGNSAKRKSKRECAMGRERESEREEESYIWHWPMEFQMIFWILYSVSKHCEPLRSRFELYILLCCAVQRSRCNRVFQQFYQAYIVIISSGVPCVCIRYSKRGLTQSNHTSNANFQEYKAQNQQIRWIFIHKCEWTQFAVSAEALRSQ